MKFKANSRYTTIASYIIVVFAICLLLVSVVFKYEIFASYLNKIITALSPIIWGLVIAYILNPLMKFIEKYIKKFIDKKGSHPKLTRSLAITITVLIALSAISSLVATAIPEILGSIEKIFSNLTSYMNNLQDFGSKFLSNNPKINEFIDDEFITIRSYLINAANKLQPQFETLFNSVKNGAFSFIIGLKDALLGVIVSIYLLFSKEKLIAQSKKALFALMSKNRCEKALEIGSRANTTFIQFFSGKALDSLIIGILTFIGLSIMKMPYVVLISFIVGVTNMIPFFGPFIGAIPSALLILVEDPKKAIMFAIFILLLQQFDGNILGPKILGDSLGLPTFWILFAIFLGGGLFGFIGMIAFVPLFAVFYNIFRDSVVAKLKKKNLPYDTADYLITDGQPVSTNCTDKKS